MKNDVVLAIDMGTGGARAAIIDAAGQQLGMCATEWTTSFPAPGRAEQDPAEWWRCIVEAVRGAVADAGVDPKDIRGIGCDSTSATVCLLKESGEAVRPAIMWMDVRAAAQADRLARCGDPALAYCGFGDVSAEWGLPKAMWLMEREPENFEAAHVVGDCTDWLVHRLTGEWTMSINHAAGKYFYDRGWPTSLYAAVGATPILEKFPQRLLPIGELVGGLREDTARELGLEPGTPVAEGAIDAHAGAIGLGVVEPGKLALITGSSHVMIGQSATPLHSPGLWGSYTDAIIVGEHTIEAGQASTGSVVAWFKNNLAHKALTEAAKTGCDPYDVLDRLAREIPRGADGLMCLDHFQGNRSPYVDPYSRGMFFGLSLGHTEGHMFRAIIEGVCFGTETIFAKMREQNYVPEEIVVSGGPTKSKLWMQTHADVSNVPLTLTSVSEGPLVGSAMLATLAAGLHPDLPTAANEMVSTLATIEPDPEAHEAYKPLVEAYEKAYFSMKDLYRELAARSES